MTDKLQSEVEFTALYKRDPKQAISLMYGKLLDVEQKVDDVKHLMSILFGLIVVPIVGIIIAAFFKAILKV